MSLPALIEAMEKMQRRFSKVSITFELFPIGSFTITTQMALGTRLSRHHKVLPLSVVLNMCDEEQEEIFIKICDEVKKIQYTEQYSNTSIGE